MNPLFCFYKDNSFAWSEDYLHLFCDQHSEIENFLNKTNLEFYNNLKIIKINFDAFSKNESPHQILQPCIKTNLIDVFILKTYQIISEQQLKENIKEKAKSDNPELIFKPLVNENHFKKIINSIKSDINSGRFYQINFTAAFRASIENKSFSTWNFLNNYFNKIPGSYKSYLPLKENEIFCFSPELFLQKENDQVITQPIKGTLSGQMTEDELMINPKEQAELSMIVDLLRNDLNAISCSKYNDAAKVHFHRNLMNINYTTHTYSEIGIRSSKSFYEIISLSMPGGSISGCPKIESLKKISEVEVIKRDFYTGSIGWWKQENFKLNIAIRSFIKNQNDIYYFTGCGIVSESDPQSEWTEFLRKAQFLNLDLNAEFIVDTLRLDKAGFYLKEEHISRTENAFKKFHINFKKEELIELYNKIELELSEKLNNELTDNKIYKVRIVFLNSVQIIQIQYEEINSQNFSQEVILKLCPWPNTDYQRFKSTNRQTWDDLLADHIKEKNNFDVLTYNKNGLIMETSKYSIFYKKDEIFYTPTTASGCLWGTLQNYYLRNKKIIINKKEYTFYERDLHINEIFKTEIYVGNSVRGIFKARVEKV